MNPPPTLGKLSHLVGGSRGKEEARSMEGAAEDPPAAESPSGGPAAGLQGSGVGSASSTRRPTLPVAAFPGRGF